MISARKDKVQKEVERQGKEQQNQSLKSDELSSPPSLTANKKNTILNTKKNIKQSSPTVQTKITASLDNDSDIKKSMTPPITSLNEKVQKEEQGNSENKPKTSNNSKTLKQIKKINDDEDTTTKRSQNRKLTTAPTTSSSMSSSPEITTEKSNMKKNDSKTITETISVSSSQQTPNSRLQRVQNRQTSEKKIKINKDNKLADVDVPSSSLILSAKRKTAGKNNLKSENRSTKKRKGNFKFVLY